MATDVKREIAEVFLKNAGKKGIDKITVNSIVKECNISRQAFYYYYQDIVDVARYALRESLKITFYDNADEDDPEKVFHLFAKDIAGKFPYVSMSLNSKLRSEIEHMFITELRNAFSIILARMSITRDLTRRQIEFRSDFLACAIASYSSEHCNDINFDTDEFADQFCDILNLAYYK